MPTWLQIFLACGGSVLIASIVTGAINWIKARHAHIVELEEKEKDKTFRAIMADSVADIKSDISSIKNTLELDTKSTVASIRSTMKILRDQYMEQGYADAGDKGTWLELYAHYKELGGNHFKEYVDQWKHDVENLPNHK